MEWSVTNYSTNEMSCLFFFRHQPEVNALQEEIDILNEHLDDSKYEQEKQKKLINTLKEVSV